MLLRTSLRALGRPTAAAGAVLCAGFVLAGFVLAGCSGDERLAPVPTGATTGAGTSSVSSTSTGEGGAGSGGGDAPGGGGAGGSDDPCPLLTPGETSLFFSSIARVGLEAPVDRPLEDLWKTRLQLELYEDDGSGELPPLVPGVFDLSVAPDDNYGTCQHCVLLVGSAPNGQPLRAFSAIEGTMTISELGDDFFLPTTVGRVEGLRLAEVTQNPDFTWELIPGGECFRVADWSFDTTPMTGGPCASAEACPNEALEICDPGSGTCQEGQCSLTFDPPFCDAGELCFSQLGALDGSDGGPAIGACYTECDPASGGGCSDGDTCVPLGPTQAIGYCLAGGGPAVGEPCDPADIATGCAPGAICRGEPGVCAQICDYLTEDAGCPEGTFCAGDNSCRSPDAGDAAAVGEACDINARFLMDCGVEGDAFRGICINFFPQDLGTTCERLCRTEDPSCPGDEQCLAGLFSNPAVGICRAPAVCGDGELDVLGGEVCDDGNDQGGDGCSADCLSAELGFLCETAPELPLGAPIEGTNDGGATGYTSQCDPYLVNPVARWTFTPPAAGKLVLTLESAADLGFSVLGDCDDPGTELGCVNQFGDDTLEVNFLAAAATPALVMVRGSNPSEISDFTMTAEFIVAVCGDGDVGGGEVCDDGNTDGGDGCSADCSTIVWENVCSALPALVLDQDIAGDTTDGTHVFDLAGFCSFVGGSGPERAYSFVAPADGTLSLLLEEPEADLSLFVRRDCGPIDDVTYLSCSNSGSPGGMESVMVELLQDQLVTVIVDGFTPSQAGAFTLNATFDPG